MSRNHESIITQNHPEGAVVLGGMGVGVSSPELAGAVAHCDAMGTISETASGVKLTRILQDGDPSGLYRQALETFPNQEIVERVLRKFYLEDGVRPERRTLRYRPVEKFRLDRNREAEELAVLGVYCDVTIAKLLADGYGQIGTNGLTKIDRPTAAGLYGGMLAGADYTARGAGVPLYIPGMINELHAGNPVEYEIKVAGGKLKRTMQFDPARYNTDGREVSHPEFWGIVSHPDIARALADAGAKAIIIESSLAGGHNAPSSGPDIPIEQYPDLGVPYLLAGGEASNGLAAALERGAAGVQAGSAFALTEESGMAPSLRQRALKNILGRKFRSEPREGFSPTEFPFYVSEVDGTLADKEVYEGRERVCDIEMLATAYEDDDKTKYRCMAEPTDKFTEKTRSPLARRNMGTAACLCNALFETIGMGQRDVDREEPAVLTLGARTATDVRGVIKHYGWPITAAKVVDYIRTNKGQQ